MDEDSTCPIAFIFTRAGHIRNLTSDAGRKEIEDDLRQGLPAAVALALLLLFASTFVLLRGGRYVKWALFIVAFFTGAMLTLLVLPAVLESGVFEGLDDDSACLTAALTPLIVGLMAGGMALWLLRMAFALLGAGAGGSVGYVLHMTILHNIRAGSADANGNVTWMFVGSVFGGALIGSVLLVRSQRSVLKLATAAVGAVGATAACSLLLAHADVHFLGAFKPSSIEQEAGSPHIWAQAALVVVFFGIGVREQFFGRSARKRRKDERSNSYRAARGGTSSRLQVGDSTKGIEIIVRP